MKLVILLLIIFPCSLFASSSSGHEASMKDLLWPALSFTSVFSVLLYKLSKVMTKYFRDKAKTVEHDYNSAQGSIEKANLEYKEALNKKNNLDVEKEKINKSFSKAAVEFEAKSKEDIKQQFLRIEKETVAMANYEKNKLEFELKKDLVDSVMELAREKIISDGKKSYAASTNILNKI